ncbi:unnamed protein product [Dibothriocephalus latus]|uniref:Uncharacterized protein n=1 Tax=Dibothriocephalus latus TaxID=60516 RepID=A0A3P7NE10_DIBLA|nr:unnamed protein product [Dibothriocephalus latus]
MQARTPQLTHLKKLLESMGLEYSNGEEAIQFNEISRHHDLLLRTYEELGQKLETASNEHFAFMQVNQNFNRWIQQKMELAQMNSASVQNLAQVEDALCKLKNLEEELLAGVEQQQTLVEATNKAATASSRALRAASSPNRYEPAACWMTEEATITEEKWRVLKLDVTQVCCRAFFQFGYCPSLACTQCTGYGCDHN